MFSIFKKKSKGALEVEQVAKGVDKIIDVPIEIQTPAFIELYPVYEPYVYIGISKEADGKLKYNTIEPVLSEEEKKSYDHLFELLKVALQVDVKTLGSKETVWEYLKDAVFKIIKRFDMKVKKSTFDKLMYYLERDLLRYTKIDPMMRDPLIEDISCNGAGIPVYVWHRNFESIPTNILFEDQEKLDRFILRLAYMSGRHISVAQPLLDAGLPEGSRIQMSYGSEVTKKGSTFTIRKFKEDPFSIIDLITFGTMSSEISALMWLAIENKLSIVVAGGTASGKTTTINCLAMFIRPEAKIVTIEDTPEINLPHQNWIRSISRPSTGSMGEVTLFDLLRAALRQRPDFIIVGEVRGSEAYTLFQALSTGHAGISSIHADAVPAVFHRLTSDPMNIPRTLIPAVNFVLLQSRITKGDRPARRILSTTELLGLDTRTNEFLTNEAYRYDMATDTFVQTGRSYMTERLAAAKGLSPDAVKQELSNRRIIFDWMVQKNIRKYRDVADVVRRYYTDQEALLSQVRIEKY